MTYLWTDPAVVRAVAQNRGPAPRRHEAETTPRRVRLWWAPRAKPAALPRRRPAQPKVA